MPAAETCKTMHLCTADSQGGKNMQSIITSVQKIRPANESAS